MEENRTLTKKKIHLKTFYTSTRVGCPSSWSKSTQDAKKQTFDQSEADIWIQRPINTRKPPKLTTNHLGTANPILHASASEGCTARFSDQPPRACVLLSTFHSLSLDASLNFPHRFFFHHYLSHPVEGNSQRAADRCRAASRITLRGRHTRGTRKRMHTVQLQGADFEWWPVHCGRHGLLGGASNEVRRQEARRSRGGGVECSLFPFLFSFFQKLLNGYINLLLEELCI